MSDEEPFRLNRMYFKTTGIMGYKKRNASCERRQTKDTILGVVRDYKCNTKKMIDARKRTQKRKSCCLY